MSVTVFRQYFRFAQTFLSSVSVRVAPKRKFWSNSDNDFLKNGLSYKIIVHTWKIYVTLISYFVASIFDKVGNNLRSKTFVNTVMNHKFLRQNSISRPLYQ